MALSVAVPMALPAGAALKSSVSCKTETSPPLAEGKVKSTIGTYTGPLKAGGTSTTKAKPGATAVIVTSTTIWKNNKGTTTATIKYKGAKTKGKCKAPYDTTITGKVTKATGAAATITKKGEPVTVSICAISKAEASQGKTTIEPGTLFKL